MAECETCGCRLGTTVKTPIDRSLGFTAMLELYPGFGAMPDTEGMGITTAFLEDWYRSGHTGMYEYAREWVDQRTRTVLVGDTYETPEDAAQYALDEAAALEALGDSGG